MIAQLFPFWKLSHASIRSSTYNSWCRCSARLPRLHMSRTKKSYITKYHHTKYFTRSAEEDKIMARVNPTLKRTDDILEKFNMLELHMLQINPCSLEYPILSNIELHWPNPSHGSCGPASCSMQGTNDHSYHLLQVFTRLFLRLTWVYESLINWDYAQFLWGFPFTFFISIDGTFVRIMIFQA